MPLAQPRGDGPGRIGRYVIQNILGRGAFATVRIARHELTGEQVAIKILNMTNYDARSRSRSRPVLALRLPPMLLRACLALNDAPVSASCLADSPLAVGSVAGKS